MLQIHGLPADLGRLSFAEENVGGLDQ